MFPLPFNFPFRKKDGTLTTLDDAITSGGGSYTLPTASASVKGGVKVGAGLEMEGEVLKNTNPTPYSLPTAAAEVLGGVKVGSGLSIDENGILSASGGGGSSLYCHCITISTGNVSVTTLIINDSSTAIGVDALKTFLTDNGFTLSDKLYFASGKSSASAWAIGLGIGSNVIKVYDTAGQWVNVTSGIVDVVIAI